MGALDEKGLKNIQNNILPVLPEKISVHINKINLIELSHIEEIRIRAGKPLMVSRGGFDYCIDENGILDDDNINMNIISSREVERTLQLLSDYSLYAFEEEIKQGFFTIRGGNRVGISGRVISEGLSVRTIKNISGINIRIAREVKGCGLGIVKCFAEEGIKNTLIISPPGCGKTTVLRDMVRIISNGDPSIKLKGRKVGLVDERSEIAGCYFGIPQRDIGVRTDVLDACHKTQGILMLIRAMSPAVIAVDEIGGVSEGEAVIEALNSGVKVIATAHGNDEEDIKRRSGIRMLLNENAFDKAVILSSRNGPGTVEKIIDLKKSGGYYA